MKIKIVAAIVDTKQLTLYQENGETIIIKQGDHRLRPVLDQVTPQIISKGFAELLISDITIVTGFEQFEKQSGVVRFFKVARTKLANLFNPQVDEAIVGKKPKTMETAEEKMAEAVATTQAAIEEILLNAQPVTDATFNTDNIKQQGNIIESSGITDNQRHETESSHTVVAHVDGKLIPNMERIETHLARAAKLGSTAGVELFLKRLASVIDQRSHSVEDLLKFMERSDMPIADDGSVVIYKVLRRAPNNGEGYLDCHTRKIPQKVGSYVHMDIELVDRVRNNECSNGLHVARRGYISSFSGDVCTIAKLAPEDVVTVPSYNANKMRVMGYHILAELPDDLYSLVKKNKPITELQHGKELLAKILMGDHVDVLENVRITKQNGEGVFVMPVNKSAPVAAIPDQVLIEKIKKDRVERGNELIPTAEALANPEQPLGDSPMNPKDVIKKVTTLSRKEQAQKLFKAYKKNPTQKNKDKLIAYKKFVKQGWKALGIDESEL